MAAFRLASKGKTMADSSYESEVHGIEAFLAMQRNKDNFKNTTAPGGVSCDCSKLGGGGARGGVVVVIILTSSVLDYLLFLWMILSIGTSHIIKFSNHRTTKFGKYYSGVLLEHDSYIEEK